jgi:hypothetical protein
MATKEKEFKARCSSLGKIFTNPRSKAESISETTKTYLEEWMVEQKFGIRKDIASRYLEKGLQMEDTAIQEYANLFKVDAVKNDEWFENDYITGTPDIILDNKIVDIKCSFSAFTFPMFDTELKNKAYEYQLQGYMYLTGKTESEIAYFLLNSPESVILGEAKKILYTEALGQEWLDIIVEEVREAHSYDDIDIKDRCKIFKVERDDTIISEIKNRVENCRDYVKQYGF